MAITSFKNSFSFSRKIQSHIFINNSGSNGRATNFQLCTERGDCHKLKYAIKIAVAYIVYALFNNKDGCYFGRLFLQ